MLLKAKRIQSLADGNTRYPLPLDYDELTLEGQRLARVNAVSLQETPEDLVWAWSFFRKHYLEPLPPGIWYKPPLYPSPPAHYRLIYDIGAYARNVQGMPRAFAKSTLLNELFLLWAVSRPTFKVLVIKSAEDFVKETITLLKFQLTENPLILDDFGNQKPSRNETGMWSSTHLWLRNNFRLDGRSVLGKLLGFRPNFVAIDDAEFDPIARIAPQLLTDNLRELLFNHILPQLDAGCTLAFVGTLLSRKTLLYYMATTPEDEDPRLAYWNRVILGVEDEESEDGLLWKEKFSRERCIELKEQLGVAEYAAQYMNEPGSSDERLLNLHQDLGYYTVRNPDEAYTKKPFDSEATLVNWIRDKDDEIKQVERPFGKTVKEMYRFLVADPIRKPSSTSDWACAMVIGVERSRLFKDLWYVLDMKLGRVKDTVFLDWIWELGSKWFVKVCGIEAVSTQNKIIDQARANFSERLTENGWMPRVLGIRYPGDYSQSNKANRISGLAWRYDVHKIVYPKHLENRHPWSDLVFQTDNFTEDMRLLSHDDALDTLAMGQFVIKPGGSKAPPDVMPEGLMELLASGCLTLPGTSIPVTLAIDPSRLTMEAQAGLDKLCWADRRKLAKEAEAKRKARFRRNKRPGFMRKRRSA